jgi:iron complex outermembrane receptor protein
MRASTTNTIIVTAQRRAEALEDVPMTVAVVSQETLSNLGVNTVRDLQNVTTGFQIGNSGSYPQPSIRGVTTINAGSYENNVAVYVDGLYQSTPQGPQYGSAQRPEHPDPQGPSEHALWSQCDRRAILIDTIDPGNTWTGNFEATYARFDDRRARGFVSGPISDKIGFSVAGTYRQTDGYYKKASITTPGQFVGRTLGLEQEAVRAKLKFDLTDTFRATLAMLIPVQAIRAASTSRPSKTSPRPMRTIPQRPTSTGMRPGPGTWGKWPATCSTWITGRTRGCSSSNSTRASAPCGRFPVIRNPAS